MRFSLKTVERTYGLETGHTAQSVTIDVRPRAQTYGQSVIGKLHFYHPSHSSCFPYSRAVLVEIWLIEGFSQIWRTPSSDVHYFLKYLIVNTWTYETPFEPLCKSAGHTLGLADILYLSPSTINTLYPLCFLTLSDAPRLPVHCLWGLVSVSVLPEEELLRFHFTKVTLGYLAFYYVVMQLDCCFVVVVSLVTP